MTNLRELYYCTICHNLTEVVNEGAEALVCCEQAMTKLIANSTTAATDKHIPVITEDTDGIWATIGEIDHPMLETHHIKFIEIEAGNMVYRAELKVGEAPKAFFPVKAADVDCARAWCNLHGLWNNL